MIIAGITEGAPITTGNDVASMALVRFHQRMIELGRESITTIDQKRRDIGAITVCVSDRMAQRMKEEVQAFRKRLLRMAEESEINRDPDQVYQVNIQMFPMSK